MGRRIGVLMFVLAAARLFAFGSEAELPEGTDRQPHPEITKKASPVWGAVRLRSGAGFGFGLEHVYQRTGLHPNRLLLSELVWPINPLGKITVEGDIYIKSLIHLQLGADIFFPARVQDMTDSDFSNRGSSVKTHFSRHTNTVNFGVQGQCAVGFMLPVQTEAAKRRGIVLQVEPRIGLVYMGFRWTASDGYTQYPFGSSPYPPWTEDMPKEAIRGDGIRYTVHAVVPVFGVDFSLEYKMLIFSFGADASPFLGAFAQDLHYKKDRRYEGLYQWGWGVGGHLSLMFVVAKSLAFELKGSYRTAASFTGETAIYQPITAEVNAGYGGKGAEGFALNIGQVSIGLVIFFGSK